MIAFAALLERLAFTPSRNTKIALLKNYFAETPDPDRGYALAAMAGALSFTAAKPAMLRALAMERTDPELFAWSYDYVGDLAETVALIWRGRAERPNSLPPGLAEVVEALKTTPKADLPELVAGWLDISDSSSRYAILKLITGSLRVGASARLAKTALAESGSVTPDEIEEVWHGLEPPYTPLFAWISGHAPRPDPKDAPVFRPPMLAQSLEGVDLTTFNPSDWRAEWKWDGIRAQLVKTLGGERVYTRTAEDIGHAFPDLLEILTDLDSHVVLDGELLVMQGDEPAPFADLQQRLNRKSPARTMLRDRPAGVRLYDILFEDGEDLRNLPFDARRKRLETWFARLSPPRMTLSELIPFENFSELAALRESARSEGIEGLMLKRADSPYVPGRPRGPWWKWKREPLTVDAVMMYAQRGHGKRSSFYSDYTFGLWREGENGRELVPIGKAYSGFTDEELKFLDRWVRAHTTARFGPVREVEQGLVLEIAFDAAQYSKRHKSGVALRFPRVARIRTDKPAAEADELDEFVRTFL
ncbi:cisplatin damage response ATP-dependent DNA ligase [Acetobacter oeni]|uniref:DNA ligase (ATP) n=1 Tax=Acetobacter oeni TaxID=304077 RepID=A0A511XIE5_9PROT|nr:cisplatin damage response ATP-dependent DNA ligase [Acetobacter oeni]MBB3881448.1 DNA ligase-1 [Acetobacter oeni]NHO18313.1 cisplatin damage response ATP-dependent DNA ligase [Acetobacter oeni]GBR10961.1 ATP-dependent DNA ligase [Acetobacter oeni LMG 21952]GEN62725.1 ATP-dependent DNA ligase [Acetobacter oeni]